MLTRRDFIGGFTGFAAGCYCGRHAHAPATRPTWTGDPELVRLAVWISDRVGYPRVGSIHWAPALRHPTTGAYLLGYCAPPAILIQAGLAGVLLRGTIAHELIHYNITLDHGPAFLAERRRIAPIIGLREQDI